jgi:hypothetical protein
MLGPPHVWVVLDLVLLLGLARDPVQVQVGHTSSHGPGTT